MIRNLHVPLALGVIFAIVACAAPRVDPMATASPAADPIALATGALDQVDDPAQWIIAATELAQALHVTDKTPRANALLQMAQDKAAALDQGQDKAAALSAIAATLIHVGARDRAAQTIKRARAVAVMLDDENKRWDALGKLNALEAKNGASPAALAQAQKMPTTSNALASYKARTLHDIAPVMAAGGDFERAQATLNTITMGLPYYAATARTDVAIYAHESGRSDLTRRLLDQAISNAAAQEDGYFIAGTQRHIAVAKLASGDVAGANASFAAAAVGARAGKSAQHQARALSRIATAMADYEVFAAARPLLGEAVAVAAGESRDAFRYWAYYEIAGSAAFVGEHAIARQLLAKIPVDFEFSGKSLRAATQRDVAWGLARHHKVEQAIAAAMAIDSPRERVQALSRIARVMADPGMHALPRYL